MQNQATVLRSFEGLPYWDLLKSFSAVLESRMQS